MAQQIRSHCAVQWTGVPSLVGELRRLTCHGVTEPIPPLKSLCCTLKYPTGCSKDPTLCNYLPTQPKKKVKKKSVHVLNFFSCVQFCEPLRTVVCRLLCPWDSLGKHTGVSCHALLQGIFLTQGLNSCFLCLMHWQMGSLPSLVSYGKPKK